MLSIIARHQSPHIFLRSVVIRSLSTETTNSSKNPQTPPPAPSKHPTASKSRILDPRPRPAVSHKHQALPSLPANFGRNQLLPVSKQTRALLESIVAQFDAPIRYAFAYGSGVFEQDGYTAESAKAGEAPMLDFMFAVTHADHWHSINMHQNPSHYATHARVLGSNFVSRVEDISPGVWFNAYVPMQGVTIKYGVTTVDNLCSDLLNWRSLYLAGRMHKPLRIIKDDARVRLTQQVNLTSAVRAALLTLPADFSETELFERVAGISYTGDPRMMLPAENRGKVGNIVRKQAPQFKELYHRLVTGLPGVHWPADTSNIQQDTSALARSAHLKKLPSNLLTGVSTHYMENSRLRRELDEAAYWVKLAEDERLADVMRSEMSKIVRYPATVQSIKGVVSAGLGKSIRYAGAKVGKWWKGSSQDKASS